MLEKFVKLPRDNMRLLCLPCECPYDLPPIFICSNHFNDDKLMPNEARNLPAYFVTIGNQ